MILDITSHFTPESFNQHMEAPEGGELDQLYPICQLCDEHSAMIEVKFSTYKELVCMGCYSTSDYQRIIKRNDPKIKLT